LGQCGSTTYDAPTELAINQDLESYPFFTHVAAGALLIDPYDGSNLETNIACTDKGDVYCWGHVFGVYHARPIGM
jgi:hypothetical protein